MGTMLLVVVGLFVALVVARMAVALVRFAVIVVVALVSVFAGLMLVRAASALAARAHHFTAPHGATMALTVAALVILAFATVGVRAAYTRVRNALAPMLAPRTLRDAAVRLRRVGASVTPGALTRMTQVDRATALAWLSRNPQFMPTFSHATETSPSRK